MCGAERHDYNLRSRRPAYRLVMDSAATTQRVLVTAACRSCGKPVYTDQGYHAVTERHWECEKALTTDFEQASARVDALMSDFGVRPKRHKKSEGSGAIAIKVKAMAVAAVEEHLGRKLETVMLWNQQGAYRGDKWDLARWGIHFEVRLSEGGSPLRGSAHSWTRMTDCAKAKKMVAHREDGEFGFNVEPA